MRYILILLPALSGPVSCSDSKSGDPEQSGIRGHTEFKRGIPHGVGFQRAERLCQDCHGLGLTGGQDFIPSCYSCHGKNWLDHDPKLSLAPSGHTSQHGLFFHDPGYENAETVCSRCHGSDLTGEKIAGTPSCYLCHDNKWSP